MQAAQKKLLDELWAERKPVAVIATPQQAVTLASIVEKETAQADERPVIASVFINRLEKGMRLQSDPTIIYGIVGGKGKLDRALTRTDIETTTPYNTYRINGLPPGPIANPGRAALEAVLNPEPTDKLYFVADGSGGHAFAATLDEHNRNVKNWRKLAGNAAAAAAAEEGEAAAPAAETAPAATPAAANAGEVPVPPAAAQAPLAEVTPEPEAPPAAPAEPPPDPQTAESQPPLPQAKPPQLVSAKPAAPAAGLVALKPGTVLTVDGRATVIPRLRP
jgi:UPF0755 protein